MIGSRNQAAPLCRQGPPATRPIIDGSLLLAARSSSRPRVNSAASSELRMRARTKYRHRTAVGVVCGVGDELVVEGNARGRGEGIAVVRLDYSFEPGIGQLVVADKDTQTSVVQKLLVDAGDAIDRGGNAESVIRSPPLCQRTRPLPIRCGRCR